MLHITVLTIVHNTEQIKGEREKGKDGMGERKRWRKLNDIFTRKRVKPTKAVPLTKTISKRQ